MEDLNNEKLKRKEARRPNKGFLHSQLCMLSMSLSNNIAQIQDFWHGDIL